MANQVVALPSPQSPLGAAAYLSESGEVLFAQISTSHSLGRVSDLLSAYVAQSPSNERRLRLLASLLVFTGLKSMTDCQLSGVVQLECGLDSDNMVVAVQFSVLPLVEKGPQNWVDAVNSSEGGGPELVESLRLASRLCGQLVVREHRARGLVEVVSVHSLVEESATQSNPVLYLRVDESGETSERPIRQTELGDLDYTKLLALQRGSSDSERQPLGESLRIHADEDLNERIKAGAQRQKMQDDFVVIKGVTQKFVDERLVVKENGSEPEPKREKVAGAVSGFFKKLNPFAKKPNPTSDEQLSETTSSRKEEPGSLNSPESDASTEEITHESEKIVTIVTEIQKRIDQNIPEEIRPLLSDLIREKSKVVDIMRKASVEIRQKEIHFRGIEQSFQNELRKKDEIIQQKATSLSRANEQITTLTSQLERARKATVDTTAQNQWKTKHDVVTQSLASAKEENVRLQRKLDELKSALTFQQQASVSRSSENLTAKSEMSSMQSKLDRTQKQLDEFKKLNKQLMDKVSLQEKRKGPDSQKVDEIRTRLEQATRLANDRKAEVETMKLRLEEVEHEKTILQGEMRRIQQQSQRKPPGSGSGRAA